jgi:predicted N-acetyltransferase YhbS
MEIREGTERDMSEILRVLRASLGETSSQKTEEVWRFKHIDNPFGKSLVLLAVEKGEVIGVRAFMRWKWQRKSETFSAFRAVDTATHPNHQGKGVFKQLTLKALELGKEKGNRFVFNTPNSKSKPGYLKMGWKEVDKLKTSIKPVNPFFWKSSNEIFTYPKIWNDSNGFNFLNHYNQRFVEKGEFFTPKDPSYLKWRYVNNPLQDYHVLATTNLFLAGYVKSQGKFKELRISEAIRSSKVSNFALKKEIKSWARKYGVHFVSFSPNSDVRFFTAVTGNFGPVLTFRKMKVSEEEEKDFLKMSSWAYSLGDLELF